MIMIINLIPSGCSRPTVLFIIILLLLLIIIIINLIPSGCSRPTLNVGRDGEGALVRAEEAAVGEVVVLRALCTGERWLARCEQRARCACAGLRVP